jgi:hypothetical protein
MTANLELEFDKFVDLVYKIPHDTDQYREMKKVWYSGMLVLFNEILLASQLPKPHDVTAMTRLHNQIDKGMTEAISR